MEITKEQEEKIKEVLSRVGISNSFDHWNQGVVNPAFRKIAEILKKNGA